MSKAQRPRYLNGPALRAERLAAGLGQAQLADLVNQAAREGDAKVIQPQISAWERGLTGCRIGTLHQLADALGIPPSALMLPEAMAAA